MTDVIVVDEQGRFVIGKAPTTRHDESIGYMESLADALSYWELSLETHGRTCARIRRRRSTPARRCSTPCSTATG